MSPPEKQQQERSIDLEQLKTPWRSLAWCCAVLFLLGVQWSVYYNSLWPYLSGMDSTVSFTFMGIIVASYSVGQIGTSPLFGWWNQRTLSVRFPGAVGIVLTAIGNLLYAVLPLLPTHDVRWYMLVSRFLVGLGSGNLVVFRAYVAMASTQKDRNRAVALSTGSYVLGIAAGPAVQMAFTPIGETGHRIGNSAFHLNMYTMCAVFMFLLNLISLVLMLTSFRETYSGVKISKDANKTEETTSSPLPKFDRLPVAVLLYVWFVYNIISTNLEAMSSPLTQVLFNWKDKEAVFWNGLFHFSCSAINVCCYAMQSLTRVGKIDPKKLVIFACTMFALYYIVVFPWPFWPNRTRLIRFAPNSTTEDTSYDGGCYRSYKWCPDQHRPPVEGYVFAYSLCLGLSFPFITVPIGVLYSQILGPRNQGNMQDVLAFVGGSARVVAPVVSTFLFQHTGYVAQSVICLAMLALGVGLVIVTRKRLVPLKVTPPVGKSVAYKNGMFTRF